MKCWPQVKTINSQRNGYRNRFDALCESIDGICQEHGAEDTLYKEFCMLDRSFRKHPDLRMALENPILTIREKLTLICTAAVGDAPAGREFARFMTLVLKNRRENFLQYICLSFWICTGKTSISV